MEGMESALQTTETESESTSPGRTRLYTILLIGLALLTARRLWLPQISTSFWLDETGTAWMIKGNLWDALSHSFRFQGGHTLYIAIEWLVRQVTGLSEVGLRIPSVLGMAGACYFVYRLGRRIYDHWVGLFAAVFLVFLPQIAFAATDARPYALAIMFLSASTLALMNWLESQRLRDAVLYAAPTAAAIYLHYMFMLPLVAHLVYLLYRVRAGDRFELKKLVQGPAVLMPLLLPTIPTLLRVMRESKGLSNPYRYEAHQVLDFLLPSSLLHVLVASVLVACLFSAPRLKSEPYRAGALPLLVAWIAIPSIVLYELSSRGTNVFVPRYFLMLTPPLSLMIALGIRQLKHTGAQVALIAICCVAALRFFPTTSHTLEDWRAAAAAEREAVTDPDTPVLLFSGFIEAAQVSFLTDPEKASYLNAPAAMYPMEGRLIPIPFTIQGETEVHMLKVVQEELLPSDGFILVTRGETHKAWLDAQVAHAGFTSTLLASFDGSVTVFEYSKT